MTYFYFLTLVDNVNSQPDYVSSLFVNMCKVIAPITLSLYGVLSNSKPHIHVLIETSKPISYKYIASKLRKGFSMRIHLLKSRKSIKRVIEYIDSHNGDFFDLSFEYEPPLNRIAKDYSMLPLPLPDFHPRSKIIPAKLIKMYNSDIILSVLFISLFIESIILNNVLSA